MEVEEEEDLKRSGEFEEVEEEKMEEEEEEEERPLPPLPHLPPRAPAQDRGNQAMVFGIQCLWQQRSVNITSLAQFSLTIILLTLTCESEGKHNLLLKFHVCGNREEST